MYECKSLTLTEHRHNVRPMNMINVTSRVKICIRNNMVRLEIRVDSCQYQHCPTAVRINFTYTVMCIKPITTSVNSNPLISMMDIEPFFFFFFLESFLFISYSPLQVLFKIREILKSSPVLSPTAISFLSTLHNVHHSFDHLTLTVWSLSNEANL